MSANFLGAEERVFTEECESFPVPEQVLITGNSWHRLVEARRKVDQAPTLNFATRVDALVPRATSELRRLGLNDTVAMQISREFVRLLTGLLLTQGLAPGSAGLRPKETNTLRKENSSPKMRVFLRLLEGLMVDLVALCAEHAEGVIGWEADIEAAQRLRHDRLTVIARLCRAQIAVGDAGEQSIRQLTEGLLAWRSDMLN